MKQSAAPTNQPSQLSFLASYLIIAILVLLPFHALLTTWAGSNAGHLDAFRIWKELLLVPLGVYAVILVARNPALLKSWTTSWLVRLVLVYGLFTVGFGAKVLLAHEVTTSAVIYSLLSNLRFLWFMLVVWAITDTNSLVRRQWAKIVLLPACVVVGFGLVQRLFLPADFLRHFGYGPKTIPAIETIDQKLAFRRIQSTLRGANPLGAYLIMPIITAIAYIRRRSYLGVFIVASLIVLFFTYSRSAILGLVAAVGFYGWHSVKSQQMRRWLVVATAVSVVILSGGTWLFRDNNSLQNTIFHSDETSQSTVSSNAARTKALQQGAHDIWHEPLGRGPGTAGPASTRNQGQGRLAENYFLQIGQEFGLFGLVLFIGITVLVAKQLWRRTDPLARVLLASFVGITVVNLVSHAWADDTLGLLWWGLAGAALSAPDILKRKHEQKAKTKKV